jgi:hypothetical protein
MRHWSSAEHAPQQIAPSIVRAISRQAPSLQDILNSLPLGFVRICRQVPRSYRFSQVKFWVKSNEFVEKKSWRPGRDVGT